MRIQAFYPYLITIITLFLASCFPMNKGEKLMAKHQYKEAITHYSERISRIKYYPGGYHQRGVAYMGIGDYESAEKDFDSSLVLYNSSISALVNKAICCMYLGKMDKAAAIVKEATRMDNANAMAATLRALLKIYNEQYEEALPDLNFARKYTAYQGYRFCDRYCHHYHKALLYNKLGRLPDAIDQVQSLVKLEKHFTTHTYYMMGCCYLKNGKKEEANKYFKLCIDSSAHDNSPTLKAKIRLNYPADRLTAGISADSILLNDTANTMAYRFYDLACFYTLKKDYEKAISYLAQAFDKSVFGVVLIRLDFDLEELGKLYDLNKLYLSRGKDIVSLKSN